MRKRLRFLVGPALLALAGCGLISGDGSREFEPLLLLVEKGESVLEDSRARWRPAREDFVSCLAEMTSPDYTCVVARASLVAVLDKALKDFEFAELKAELQALRLTDNPEASRARDAYVRHLRAWREYISAWRSSMPTESEVLGFDFGFYETWRQLDTTEVSSTFDETCSGLGNGQPANSDKFTSRIIDICDD